MVNENYQQQKQAHLTYSKNKLKMQVMLFVIGCTRAQKDEAIAIIRNFRESHLYPLMLIKNHVNRMAKKVDDDYILARRLKRLPTILDKLTRPTLDGQKANAIAITRMQDIGGCRIIGYQGKGKNLKGQILIAIGKNENQLLTNSVRYFAPNKNEEAIQEYGRLEDDQNLDVFVLVSVKNLSIP